MNDFFLKTRQNAVSGIYNKKNQTNEPSIKDCAWIYDYTTYNLNVKCNPVWVRILKQTIISIIKLGRSILNF